MRVAELAQLPYLFRCEPLPFECMQTRTYTSTRAATSTCCTTCTTCTPTAHRPTPSHSPFPDFVRPPALRAAGAGCARGGNAPWSAHDGIRAAREPRSVPQATCALRRCRAAHARWASRRAVPQLDGVGAPVFRRWARVAHCCGIAVRPTPSAGSSSLRCRCGRRVQCTVPAVDVGRVSPQSRHRCGRGEASPGADVAGMSPVPVQMWPGWGDPSLAQSARTRRPSGTARKFA